MKLLLQVVIYLKNTKDYGLKFIIWNGVNEVDLNCYVDSDYSEDKSKRKVLLYHSGSTMVIQYAWTMCDVIPKCTY